MNLYDYQTLKKDYNEKLDKEFRLKLFKNRMQYVHEVQQSIEDVIAIRYIDPFNLDFNSQDVSFFLRALNRISDINILLPDYANLSEGQLYKLLDPYYYCIQFYKDNKSLFSGYKNIVEHCFNKIRDYYNNYLRFYFLDRVIDYYRLYLFGSSGEIEPFVVYLTVHIIEIDNLLHEKGIYDDYSDIFDKIISAYNKSDYNLLLNYFEEYLNNYYENSKDEKYYISESSIIDLFKLCLDSSLSEKEPMLKKWNKFKGYIKKYNNFASQNIYWAFKNLHSMYCLKTLFYDADILKEELLAKGDEKAFEIYEEMMYSLHHPDGLLLGCKEVYKWVLRAINYVYKKSDPKKQVFKDDLTLYCRAILFRLMDMDSYNLLIDYMRTSTDSTVIEKYNEIDQYLEELNYEKIIEYFKWFSPLDTLNKVEYTINHLEEDMATYPKYFK